jgi:hypothetical protein
VTAESFASIGNPVVGLNRELCSLRRFGPAVPESGGRKT